MVEAIRAVHAGRRFLSDGIATGVVDDYIRRRETGLATSPLDRLTSRERQVMQLVVEGKSSAQIAGMLFLSPKTVETYRSRLMQKLGVGNVAGLVKIAIEHSPLSGD